MSRLKKLYEASASRLAIALGAHGLRRDVQLRTTSMVSKSKPFGHYIRYIKSPELTITKMVLTDIETAQGIKQMRIPRKRKVQTHSFLHATKGWRTFNRIPAALLATSRNGNADLRTPDDARQKPKTAGWRLRYGAGMYRAEARNRMFGRAA